MRTTRDFINYSLRFVRGRVLDAGGGPSAKYKRVISDVSDDYVCLDLQAGGEVDVVGDVAAMPFDGGSFDTVFCNQVLEHVQNPLEVVKESARVLKVGGYFICSAPFLEPSHADPSDFFRYTPDGLSALCDSTGLKVVESGKYGGVWTVLFSFIKFSMFDPYKKNNKWSKRAVRYLDLIAAVLDRGSGPGKIYSDSYVIAVKK